MPLNDIIGELWHVAVFFMVGGFFLKESQLATPIAFIKHKIKTIYKLLLAFYIPIIILHNWFIHIEWYETGFIGEKGR